MTRFIQPIAVVIATPNCLAARLRDIPPSIAATTRLRRSREYGLPIHAGLLPAHRTTFLTDKSWVSQVKIGVNYKFTPGMVVAKY